MNVENEQAQRVLEMVRQGATQEEVAAFLKQDFTFKSGGSRALDVEALEPCNIINMRCTVVVGNDIQSGPTYCGKPASYQIKINDGYGYCCESHKRSPKRYPSLKDYARFYRDYWKFV